MSKTENSLLSTHKFRYNFYYYCALVCAIWFALTSGAWSYMANLVISLPIGILSLIFWQAGKKTDIRTERYRIIPKILILGIIISLIAYLLIDDRLFKYFGQ